MDLTKPKISQEIYLDFIEQSNPEEKFEEKPKKAGRPAKEKRPRGRPRKYQYEGDSFKAAVRRYQETHPLRTILGTIKQRCIKKGVEFSITEEDLPIPEFCPILGLKLTSEKGKGMLPNSISVDRKDGTKGYIKGNVQIISLMANVMKSSATPEQLLTFADWIYKTYKK